MNIPTKEGTFQYNLKQAIELMIRDDSQFEGEGYDMGDVVKVLELSGETLEDYIEMNPAQFGQAMAAVVFDYLDNENLSDIVRG
jgi:hypothetical protein